jgi:hypothetical protein
VAEIVFHRRLVVSQFSSPTVGVRKVLIAIGMTIEATLLVLWLRTGVPVVRDHSGWFLLGGSLLVASLQFLLFGSFGEILARVYFSTQNRTSYKIRTIWSHSNT